MTEDQISIILFDLLAFLQWSEIIEKGIHSKYHPLIGHQFFDQAVLSIWS